MFKESAKEWNRNHSQIDRIENVVSRLYTLLQVQLYPACMIVNVFFCSPMDSEYQEISHIRFPRIIGLIEGGEQLGICRNNVHVLRSREIANSFLYIDILQVYISVGIRNASRATSSTKYLARNKTL